MCVWGGGGGGGCLHRCMCGCMSVSACMCVYMHACVGGWGVCGWVGVGVIFYFLLFMWTVILCLLAHYFYLRYVMLGITVQQEENFLKLVHLDFMQVALEVSHALFVLKDTVVQLLLIHQ